MRNAIRRVLFETRLGDLLLRGLERVAGLALVDVGEIEGERYGATAAGVAALGRDRSVGMSGDRPARRVGGVERV